MVPTREATVASSERGWYDWYDDPSNRATGWFGLGALITVVAAPLSLLIILLWDACFDCC